MQHLQGVVLVEATAEADAIAKKSVADVVHLLQPFSFIQTSFSSAEPGKLNGLPLRFVHLTEVCAATRTLMACLRCHSQPA